MAIHIHGRHLCALASHGRRKALYRYIPEKDRPGDQFLIRRYRCCRGSIFVALARYVTPYHTLDNIQSPLKARAMNM